MLGVCLGCALSPAGNDVHGHYKFKISVGESKGSVEQKSSTCVLAIYALVQILIKITVSLQQRGACLGRKRFEIRFKLLKVCCVLAPR